MVSTCNSPSETIAKRAATPPINQKSGVSLFGFLTTLAIVGTQAIRSALMVSNNAIRVLLVLTQNTMSINSSE